MKAAFYDRDKKKIGVDVELDRDPAVALIVDDEGRATAWAIVAIGSAEPDQGCPICSPKKPTTPRSNLR